MSFSPIIGASPRVLILGTMPSVKSLDINQYYAHPQNSFWWIMSQIAKFPIELDYHARIAKVKELEVCVWDVLKDCRREGSLDSNIVRDSEVSNDIVGLLEKNPTISLIVFNGATSKAIFKRHIDLSDGALELSQLPSTSPAYASMNKQKKLEIWQSVIVPHLRLTQ